MLTLKAIITIFTVIAITGTSSAAALTEQEALLEAKKAFSDELYDRAQSGLEAYLKNFPASHSSQEARLLLGQCYFYQKKFREALYEFDLVENSPLALNLKDQAVYWQAEVYFKTGELDKAVALYDRVIEEFPKSAFLPFCYYSKAWCYYKKGDMDRTVESFQKLIQQFPGHSTAPESQLKMGEMLYDLGRSEEAEKALWGYLRRYPFAPGTIGALYLLGEIRYEQKDYKNALGFYEKGLLLYPQSGLSDILKYRIAWCYFNIGRASRALELFEVLCRQIVAADIQEASWFGQGRCYAHLGQYDKAVASYDILTERYPKSEWADDAYFWKADALWRSRDDAASIAEYQKFLQKFPKSPLLYEARYNLAGIYRELDRYSDALTELEILLEGEGLEEMLRSAATCRVADCYFDSGDYSNAASYFSKLLADDPDSLYADYAQYQIGEAFFFEGRFEEAAMAFKSVLVHFPNSKFRDRSLFQLGTSYLKMENYTEALEQFSALMDRRDLDPEIKEKTAFQIANCLYGQQKYSEARRRYKRIVRASSDAALCAAAKRQMGRCDEALEASRKKQRR